MLLLFLFGCTDKCWWISKTVQTQMLYHTLVRNRSIKHSSIHCNPLHTTSFTTSCYAFVVVVVVVVFASIKLSTTGWGEVSVALHDGQGVTHLKHKLYDTSTLFSTARFHTPTQRRGDRGRSVCLVATTYAPIALVCSQYKDKRGSSYIGE
jgi:hypothetical protein